MANDIGGWNVTAKSGANLPGIAEKAGVPNRQHIIYSIDASFSAAPAAPVLCTVTNPDVSPNTVLWQGYISAIVPKVFPAGLGVPIGAGIEVVLGAGGSSLVGAVNIHGVTR